MTDVTRKLASVRRVANVEPIPGADAIEKLTIDGWELVSAKGNFKPGDLCVYFEVDSFLPVRPEFEFLRARCFKSTKNLGDGFRLKTIKLRGQVSQGLALPMSEFFAYDENKAYGSGWYYGMPDNEQFLNESDDVTEFLGVQKYEKPIPSNLAGTVRGNFPSFLRKTDQERIQNCFGSIHKWIHYTETVEYISDVPTEPNTDDCYYIEQAEGWIKKTRVPNPPEVVAERGVFEATLKLDGSSMTVYYNEGQLGVCSRNLDLKRDMGNLFWRTAIYSGVVAALAQLGQNVAIQGELMGPGVQGNREKLEGWHFFVFDVFDIDRQEYLTPKERREWLNKQFFKWVHTNIHRPHTNESYLCNCVPLIGNMRPFDDGRTIKDILFDSEQPLPAGTDPVIEFNKLMEGIVYKSHVPGGPSFKAINNNFLLTEG